MTKNTTKTAAVAVGAMLVDDRFDPIEDARALASHKSPKIRKAIEAKAPHCVSCRATRLTSTRSR